MLMANAAWAAAPPISSFSIPAATQVFVVPPAPPLPACTIMASDPNVNGGAPVAFLTAPVGDTFTISLTVTNGTFTGPNELTVNGKAFYNVTLPISVLLDQAGVWQIKFATAGCQGSTVQVTAQ